MVINKKAQGHVEIMLSFLLFIGALIFLFIFINPFAQTREISMINNVQDKIINEISLDIGKLSVITNQTGDCYNFNETQYIGNYKEINEGNRKITIYFGEIFDNSTPNKDVGCSDANYSLGIYSTENRIVYEKIEELVSSYNSSYEGLKSSLGISGEFAFSFKNIISGEIAELSVSKQVPVGVNVEAKEFPVRVINDQGGIQELIFNLRVWR